MTRPEDRQAVMARISRALQQSQRLASSLRVLAVSKKRTAADIEGLHREGFSHFGENYLQEALLKMEALKHLPLHWHFIGGIQSNKAKALVGPFELIHSLDRWSVAEVMIKRAGELGVTQEVLIEVNVGGEASKGGLDVAEVPALIRELQGQRQLRLRGLMTMPPVEESPAVARGYFAELRRRRDEWIQFIEGDVHNLRELSMGTSADFEEAILEGATIVRLGTVLMGSR